MIKKISAKNLPKNLAFLTQTKGNFTEKLINNIVF
jgi:hypothetical protein